MRHSRTILVLALVMGSFIALWFMRHNPGGSEDQQKGITERPDGTETEHSVPLPAVDIRPKVRPESTPGGSTGRLNATPSAEERLARILSAKDEKMIGVFGNINRAAVQGLVDPPELAERIVSIMKQSLGGIWALLKKKNIAAPQPPFEIGSKVRLRGLDPSELSDIVASLQAAIAEMTSKETALELTKRFAAAAEIYVHSLEVDVSMGVLGVISGGRARIPVLYRVVERDQTDVVSDITLSDDPGSLVRQFLGIAKARR